MSSPPDWECDVFVSFKRVDPAQHFTRDLLKRLYQVGIAHCSDEETNAPGEFKGKDNKAFQQVRFALVVLSDGHFNGLVERLKGMKKPELVVIPICYPTDGVVTSSKFSDALGNQAGEISGYDLKADSTADDRKKLIDKIVERLVNEICSRPTGNTTEKVFGPFGGKNETFWSPHEIKNGISADYNKDGIKRITFDVPGDTDTKEQYGGNGEDCTYKVKFEEEEEYITSFAGYFHNVEERITWLTFRTNKRMLGPFGKKAEEYFYVPSKGQKVIKFSAGGEHFLKSIGAHVEQGSKKLCPDIVERVGLIGKRSEYKWDDGHHHANVRKIIGKYDPKSKTIRSIEFGYDETDREFWPLEAHGQMDGNNFTTGPINMGENPTSIVGAWEKGNEGNIKYLEFHTGEGEVKTIGVDEKNDEKERNIISIPKGEIVGFYGWSGKKLHGIGAYFKREPIRREASWDDKKYFGVREIRLWYDKTHIRGIRFVYDDGSEKGKTLHRAPDNARDSCEKEDARIALDYPREYLISISGSTRDDDAIKSLTFHSNRKNYGPYPPVKEGEEEQGRFFWYPSKGSRITGFYGTFQNNALQSIGVHAEAIPHIYPLKTITAFGGTSAFGDPKVVEWDDGVHTDVRAFRVSYDDLGINSISFIYDDNGSLVEGPQRGRGDVGKWIWLDFPDERLSSIKVWKSSDANDAVISHLQITTTADTYGPYPRAPDGKSHEDEIKLYRDRKSDGDRTGGGLCYNRVGFFGRTASYLNAIGTHFEPN